MGEWTEDAWCWSLNWRRSLFVWEEQLVSNLVAILEENRPCTNLEDTWNWAHNVEGTYTVKSTFQTICDGAGQQCIEPFKLLWDKSIPLKVKCILLESTALDRIPTSLNLQKKGVVIPNGSLLCSFCNTVPESGEHLLLFCHFSYAVWMHLYNLFGVETTLAGNLLDSLQQHEGLLNGGVCIKSWRLSGSQQLGHCGSTEMRSDSIKEALIL